MDDLYLQLGCETVGFRLPVTDYRQWTNNQMRAMGNIGGDAHQCSFEQMRKCGRGLAEAHIVGQTTAQAETSQELQPTERSALVGAQFADEASWFSGFGEFVIWKAGDELTNPSLGGEIVIVGWAEMTNGLS